MVYTLRFFSSKFSLFHNSNVFGSCIIHILYTVCAKIKKKNSFAKSLVLIAFLWQQLLRERARILRYMYTASLVSRVSYFPACMRNVLPILCSMTGSP